MAKDLIEKPTSLNSEKEPRKRANGRPPRRGLPRKNAACRKRNGKSASNPSSWGPALLAKGFRGEGKRSSSGIHWDRGALKISIIARKNPGEGRKEF